MTSNMERRDRNGEETVSKQALGWFNRGPRARKPIEVESQKEQNQTAGALAARKRVLLKLEIKKKKHEVMNYREALQNAESELKNLQKRLNEVKTPPENSVKHLERPHLSPGENHLIIVTPQARRGSMARKRSPSPH